MDVRIMEYMLMIEQEKSLSKAAKKLNISQSALSQALTKLEKSFNAPLFIRTNRIMVPTRIGKIYLDGSREMLKAKDEVYQAIHSLIVKGAKSITIAAEYQVCQKIKEKLIPLLKTKFPDEEFRLLPADSRLAKEYLLNHIADASFLYSRLCSNSMLNYHYLFDECLTLCVPNNLAEAYEKMRQSPDICGIPFILPRPELYFRSLSEAIIQKLSFTISKSYEAEDLLSVKQLMEQGFGVALLPGRMAREAKNCSLFPVPDEYSFGVYFTIPRYHEDDLEFDYILKAAKTLFIS